MIVWGGTPGPLNTGGRYDPGTDSWTATSTTNAPSRTIAAQGSLDRHVDRRFVGPDETGALSLWEPPNANGEEGSGD